MNIPLHALCKSSKLDLSEAFSSLFKRMSGFFQCNISYPRCPRCSHKQCTGISPFWYDTCNSCWSDQSSAGEEKGKHFGVKVCAEPAEGAPKSEFFALQSEMSLGGGYCSVLGRWAPRLPALLLPWPRESQQQYDVTFLWVGVVFWHAHHII